MTATTLPDWITARPIAHRGLFDPGRSIPENSLAGVRAAIESGYPAELDLRAAKDGVAVFHDSDLGRMTARGGRVSEMPLAELRRITLAKTGETIPSLEDVLDLTNGRVPLMLEIKNDGRPGSLERTLRDRLVSYRGDAAVVSFNPFSLGWFARHAPDIPRGQTAARFTDSGLPAWRRVLQRNFLLNFISRPHFLLYELESLPQPAASFWRRCGMKLIAYTVRSSADVMAAREHADNFIFEKIRP